MLSETLYLLVSLTLLIFPLLGGVLLQASNQQEQVVMMFGRDRWEEDSQELSIVLLSRLNTPQSRHNSHQWTQVMVTVLVGVVVVVVMVLLMVVGDYHILSGDI